MIMRKVFDKVKDDVEVIHTMSHGKDKTSEYNEGNKIVDKLATYTLKKIKDFDTHIDYQNVELYL